jgi:hypothetical protein
MPVLWCAILTKHPGTSLSVFGSDHTTRETLDHVGQQVCDTPQTLKQQLRDNRGETLKAVHLKYLLLKRHVLDERRQSVHRYPRDIFRVHITTAGEGRNRMAHLN